MKIESLSNQTVLENNLYKNKLQRNQVRVENTKKFMPIEKKKSYLWKNRVTKMDMYIKFKNKYDKIDMWLKRRWTEIAK